MNPKMTSLHKDQLLIMLMHVVTQEQRRIIMNEVPAAYNDYYAHLDMDPPCQVTFPGRESNKPIGGKGI